MLTKTIGELDSAATIDGTEYLEIEQAGESLNATVNNLRDYILTFPGEIRMYGGASAPTGWFLCDGVAKDRSTYSALYAVIGTSFGVGDGSTTYNLPDLREAVPVGAGTHSFVTGSTHIAEFQAEARTLGDWKDDQFQDHTHQYRVGPSTGVGTHAVRESASSADLEDHSLQAIRGGGTPRAGTTTRVKSVGVNFIIKY